jgi:hypothetical protein
VPMRPTGNLQARRRRARGAQLQGYHNWETWRGRRGEGRRSDGSMRPGRDVGVAVAHEQSLWGDASSRRFSTGSELLPFTSLS